MDSPPSAACREGRLTLHLVKYKFTIAAIIIAACASPGVPPGGPVDTQAPEVVKIVPDSGKTGTTPPAVVFRFDEVVSERPSGAPSLGSLFLISPRNGDVRVDWHRNELEVRPRKGWRKNTAYTITMLPGLSDLRGNTRNTGAVTTFATGATIPASRITGTLFEWTQSRPITRGLIEARLRTDTTLVYLASPDSVGSFVVRNLAPGQYIVRGFSDDNTNRALDPRESFDTVGVNLTDSSSVELYAFVHDSIGTRLAAVNLRGLDTLDLSFDNPLSPSQTISPAQIHVRGPDSVDVAVQSIIPPVADTSAAARRLKRPAPRNQISVKLARPLTPRVRYRVRVTDVTNLSGITKSSEQLLTVPAPAAPLTDKPSAVPPPAAPPPAPPIKH